MSTGTDPSPQAQRPADGRPRRVPHLAEVAQVTTLTPRMIRIVFAGPGLDRFDAGQFTDHYVKLQFPPAGADYGAPFDLEEIHATRPREQWPRTRTYTVQDWDRDRRRLTVDFVVHGDEGVAGPWAARARPDDRLQLQGPGGAYAPDPAAPRHLMVGDPSVLPAIQASLQRIPAGRPVDVIVQVADAADEIELTSPGELRLNWLHAPGDEALARAVSRLELPAGVDAFVHGEASAVCELRRHLIVERGIPKESLSVSGYWKRARTEEGWREDKPEWNRLVEADALAPA